MSGFGWRPIFLVNIPLCAIGLWLVQARVEEAPRHRSDRFDVLGQVTAVLTLFVLTGAVIEAGSRGWVDPWVQGGIALAVAIGLVFFMTEARVAAPMLPLDLFGRPGFAAAAFAGAMISLTFFGLVFILSLYFQQVRGYSPALTGLAYAPLTAVIVLANILGGRLGARIGFRIPMTGGLLVAACGNGLMLSCALNTTTPFAAMVPGLMLISIGTGVAAPAMMAAALARVERARSGTASAVLTAARQVGGVVGIALFGAFVAGGAGHVAAGATAAFGLSAALLLVAAASAVVWTR